MVVGADDVLLDVVGADDVLVGDDVVVGVDDVVLDVVVVGVDDVLVGGDDVVLDVVVVEGVVVDDDPDCFDKYVCILFLKSLFSTMNILYFYIIYIKCIYINELFFFYKKDNMPLN